MLLFASEGDLPAGAIHWNGVYFHGELEPMISEACQVRVPDLVASKVDLDEVEDGVYVVKVDGIEEPTILYLWTPRRHAGFKRRGLCVLLNDVDSSETALKLYKERSNSI